MTAYYNEHDPQAAAWLRELIKQGHVAPGVVDERDIRDVKPYELMQYTQCHFFAGIGVWSYALRQAGWPDDRPVWTGSCPCQPFSAAGKRDGFDDERHLWPHWHHLITQCQPDIVFGEQVASKDGLNWLDLVQTDLEGAGYASGAVDLCAAGVGAPHIRQRLWFVAERVAHAGREGLSEQRREWNEPEGFTETVLACGMADTNQQQRDRSGDARAAGRGEPADCGAVSGMADADRNRRDPRGEAAQTAGYRNPSRATSSNAGTEQPGPTNSLWRDADWLYCQDGKWRPVEPGTFPLAHGAAARVGRLRGYGNAINAEAAKAFIEAYLG